MKHIVITIVAVLLVGCWNKAERALHTAAKQGNIDSVRKAIDDGINVDTVGYEGRTPLHEAAFAGHKDTVAFLISKGADVNVRDFLCVTPMYWAAAGGHKDTVEFLASKGADINARDGVIEAQSTGVVPLANTRWTPLHIASSQGRIAVVEFLISHGAEVNTTDNDDETPLDWTRIINEHDTVEDNERKARNCPKIADLLRKHGGKTGEELKAEEK